jgi:cytochrome P450
VHDTAAMTKACPVEIVEVTDYHELSEVLRSKQVTADAGGPHDGLYRRGTLLRLDDDAHLARRKAMNNLVKRDAHRWFRQKVLVPTIEAALQALPSEPGTQRRSADLVPFLGRCFLRMAAAMVGLHQVESGDGLARLDRIRTAMHTAFRGSYEELAYGFEEDSPVGRAAIEAMAEFDRDFVTEALARHRAMWADVELGRMNEADCPRDLLFYAVKGIEPAWADHHLLVREALQVISGATNSSTQTLVNTLDELLRWFDEHPEDRALDRDDQFLLGAVNDSIRLHPPSPAMIRRALEDITLCRGTVIKAGQYISLPSSKANLEPSVFGADAGRFNPRRVVSRPHRAAGLSFGGGAHTCLGMPLVMGNEGIDGTMVHALKRLFTAGVRRDDNRPPSRVPQSPHKWASYPIAFDSL